MKQEMIGGVSGKVIGILGDLGDLMVKMQHGVITPEHLEKFLNKENPFINLVITLEFVKSVYDDLGIECNFPEVEVPQGNVWPVVVPRGMTPARAYAIAQKLFSCHSNRDNLNKNFPNERARKTKIHFFQANVEADEVWKNHSVIHLGKTDVKRLITLTQRILMEIVYFKVTDSHLDINNLTLCAGSRDYEGEVPCAYWADGKFNLGWCGLGSAGSNLRARAAV